MLIQVKLQIFYVCTNDFLLDVLPNLVTETISTFPAAFPDFAMMSEEDKVILPFSAVRRTAINVAESCNKIRWPLRLPCTNELPNIRDVQG